MKSLLSLLISSFLLILSAQEVSGQVQANTVAVGLNLLYQDNRWQDSERYWTTFTIRPDVKYFYKENRSVVAGGTFSNERSQHVSRFSDGSEYLWRQNIDRRGAYVGMAASSYKCKIFYNFRIWVNVFMSKICNGTCYWTS